MVNASVQFHKGIVALPQCGEFSSALLHFRPVSSPYQRGCGCAPARARRSLCSVVEQGGEFVEICVPGLGYGAVGVALDGAHREVSRSATSMRKAVDERYHEGLPGLRNYLALLARISSPASSSRLVVPVFAMAR